MTKNLNQRPSVGVMMSYGTGRFLMEFLTGAYGIMAFFFYEKEMGLPTIYPTIATIIYSIWNAVNDPLIGWITGKKPVLAQYGKRLFWIVLGLILASLAFLLIFMVPETLHENKVAVFIWMVVAICLYDASYSIWEVNYQGVFPDKFRSQDVRRKTAVTSTAFGSVGIALGAVLPPMFYHYGDTGSYITAALVIAVIGVIGSMLIIPGVMQRNEAPAAPEEEMGFVDSLKSTVRHREFLILATMLFLYQSACICMTGSVNYVVNGVLGLPAKASTPIFAAMLIGALISVIIWSRVAKKLDNNFLMLIITNFFMAAAAFPMLFCRTQLAFSIFMFLWGFGFGGCWTFIAPAMADVVDSIVLKERKRNEGMIMGVRAFFMRLSYASQGIVFWLCHSLTGYDNAAPSMQAPLAQWGITAHIGLVPSLFFLAAALLLLITKPIPADKARANRKALKELGL
ncbi:MAG: MFS transporter [Bacteroidales bacterium]|nr:MFS transporter [Candidatus Cryptobacteroides equifaecalis]